MVARTLARLIMVPLGLLLGTVAAGFIFVTLGVEKVTKALGNHGSDLAAVQSVWALVQDLGALATVSTIAPVFVLVVAGEVARIRAPGYYIIGGGAALAIMPLLAHARDFGAAMSQFGLIWQVFATAGFAGGAVYWLVAGRNA